MLYRRLALLLAFVLLSANLLSVDFDGGAFEGKGIETAVLYLSPSVNATTTNRQKASAAQARYTALQEEQSVSAFEVPFTLISKYHVSLLHIPVTLPAFVFPRICVPVASLVCLTIPRSPPRPPTDLRSFSLRAPPLSLTPFA